MESFFEQNEPCPCYMMEDMKKCEDVYSFIQDNYPEIDEPEKWYNMPPAYLKCTHCILSMALEMVRIRNYQEGKIARLANALDIVSNRISSYLETKSLNF